MDSMGHSRLGFWRVPRKLRIEYPEAVYHLMKRGIGARPFSATTRIVSDSSGLWATPAKRESEEAHAERLLQGELRRRKWSEEELSQRRKGDRAKLKIAWHLRQKTTMTLKWIAQRLQAGRRLMKTLGNHQAIKLDGVLKVILGVEKRK